MFFLSSHSTSTLNLLTIKSLKITKSEEILNLGIKIAKLKKSQIRGNKKPKI